MKSSFPIASRYVQSSVPVGFRDEAESSNSEQYFETIPINSRILQDKHLKTSRELQECDLKDIKPIVAFGLLFDPKVLHRQAREERNPILATGKYGVLIKSFPSSFSHRNCFIMKIMEGN